MGVYRPQKVETHKLKRQEGVAVSLGREEDRDRIAGLGRQRQSPCLGGVADEAGGVCHVGEDFVVAA